VSRDLNPIEQGFAGASAGRDEDAPDQDQSEQPAEGGAESYGGDPEAEPAEGGAESYGGDPDAEPSVTEREVERGMERDQAEG
jgi:hypothetical protein